MAMLVSHICSLLEAAFLSITPSQLADMRVSSPGAGKIALELKRDISKPLAVILITNTAAHTIGATLAGASLDAICHGSKHHAQYMTLFSLAFTMLMIQYTELLPKTIGCRFNTSIVRMTAAPMRFVVTLFTPLIWLTDFFNRPFERKKGANAPSTTEEISALAALARSSQMISRYQERIIKMVPNLSQRTAKSVMIETENISFIDSRLSLADALTITGRDFHTRYPVCEDGDINRILGYVNIKELVTIQRSHPGTMVVTDIMRPISFVNPGDTASELLEGFASRHCHMMIVRDKDKKTLGLVTLEDIVEELLGDLDDEFDPLPRTFYSPREFVWVVGGGVPMTLLARDTLLDLPHRAEPAALWFAGQLDRPARVGDVFRYRNAEFHVRKTRRHQVWEFNVKRITSDSEQETQPIEEQNKQ